MPRSYAPYRDGTEALTATEHGSVYSVTITPNSQNYAAEGTPFEVAPAACTVTFDEAWSIHIQAQLTIPLGTLTDPQQLAALDQRYPAQVVIRAGYLWPDGTTDLQTLATLYVRSRRISEPGNVVTLQLVSWEALVEEYIYLAAHTPRTVNVVSWLVDHLTKVMDPIACPPIVNKTGVSGGGGAGRIAGITYPRGGSAGTSLTEVAARAQVWVHADSLGRCIVEPRPLKVTAPDAMAATLAKGPGGTVTALETSGDRDPWYNTVVLRYWWRNGQADAETFGTAAAYISPSHASRTGLRAYYEDINAGATQEQADAAAAAKLTHLLGRHREHQVTAVAAYWLRPGMTVQLQPADRADETGQVRSITFDLSTHTMTLATRETASLDEVLRWPFLTW